MSDPTENVFEEQEETNPEEKNEAAKPSDLDVFVDKLMAITREDGTPKYDSIEKALDALKNSQDHIKSLEADNAELRRQTEVAKQLDEAIKKLGGNMNNEEKPKTETTVDKGGLSEEAAVELVKKVLNEAKQTDAAVNNLRTVNDKLKSKYGEKASEVVASKAKELGTTPDKLKQLSIENPNLVLSLFGANTNGSTNPSTSSHSVKSEIKREEIKRPEKSLISGVGATDKARKEFMARIKEEVYLKNSVNVEQE